MQRHSRLSRKGVFRRLGADAPNRHHAFETAAGGNRQARHRRVQVGQLRDIGLIECAGADSGDRHRRLLQVHLTLFRAHGNLAQHLAAYRSAGGVRQHSLRTGGAYQRQARDQSLPERDSCLTIRWFIAEHD
jgi:hypothetical protein